ncbi:MAG TPA: formylglycine-generating enzyme family protein [Terriglobia bacterium]|nr:formylglycine-generating enzyme family protein [Terriglobia bacterium]
MSRIRSFPVLLAIAIALAGTTDTGLSQQTTEPRIEFVMIGPGTFRMGCSMEDHDCFEAEEPAHTVRITKGFELGKYEVTQQQWQAAMGANPSSFSGDDRPVERVSWHEAQAFIQKMNERADGYRYRLPTEAEWEYAARAGATGPVAGPLVNDVAWYEDNAERKTHPVGQKKGNAWGLFDMQGNVYEWVEDWYGPYSSADLSDPSGPESGARKVLRGGAWYVAYRNIRLSARNMSDVGIHLDLVGFRIARERVR